MQCSMCGHEFERTPSHHYCPSCGESLPSEDPLRNQEEEAGSTRVQIPWENNEERGLIKPFFQTVRMVLLHPRDFFRAMPRSGGYGDPLAFGIAAGWIRVLAVAVLVALLSSLAPPPAESSSRDFSIPEVLTIVAIILVVSPLFLAAGLFVRAGIRHLFVRLVSSRRPAFQTTFRVVAYAQPTVLVHLLLIPCCVNVVEKMWNWSLQTIGLREAHGLTLGRAFVAVLPSIIATVFIWVILVGLMLFGIASGLSQTLSTPGLPL